MPSGGDGVGFSEYVVVAGFLVGLPLVAPTLTGLMLWYSYEFMIPLYLSGPKARDFADAETETATEQTDEPPLKPRGAGRSPRVSTGV